MKNELTLYGNAMFDAKILMGRVQRTRGRPRVDNAEWKAELDPLAWWCLVEVLVGYAKGNKS